MQNLDCVNSWCKYKDGFYCMENCGSYIKNGTKLCEINQRKINAKDLLVFDYTTNEDISHGTFEEVISNSVEFKDGKIKEAHYDINGSSTFIIGIE